MRGKWDIDWVQLSFLLQKLKSADKHGNCHQVKNQKTGPLAWELRNPGRHLFKYIPLDLDLMRYVGFYA